MYHTFILRYKNFKHITVLKNRNITITVFHYNDIRLDLHAIQVILRYISGLKDCNAFYFCLLIGSEGGVNNLLENIGEQCLAPPLIYAGVIYFTTFTPSYQNQGDICFLGEGTGRVYAMQYKTGMAIFNYDLTNDIEGQPPTIYKSDRSRVIGAGIPSQVVIAIVKGEVVGYIGVGGGVFSPEELGGKSIRVLYWRTVPQP